MTRPGVRRGEERPIVRVIVSWAQWREAQGKKGENKVRYVEWFQCLAKWWSWWRSVTLGWVWLLIFSSCVLLSRLRLHAIFLTLLFVIVLLKLWDLSVILRYVNRLFCEVMTALLYSKLCKFVVLSSISYFKRFVFFKGQDFPVPFLHL